MVWALALAPAAGAAESQSAAGIFFEPASESVSEPGMGRLARAQTLVPERSDVPRVAVDLNGAPGSASLRSGGPGSEAGPDEDAQAADPPKEPSTAGREETGAGGPDSPSPIPAESPSSPLEKEIPAEASEDDPSEPAPGQIVEESLAPVEADAPESSGAELESPSDPSEAEPAESDLSETDPLETEAADFPAEEAEADGAIPGSDESGGAAPTEDGIVPLVEYDAGRITVRADGEPLGDVISEIRAAGDIQINGLGHRAGDPLSFQVEDMDVEDALKRLMRQLKENNYAFEYSRTRLRRLSVFPAGQTEVARPAPAPRPQGGESAEGRERVVRVINVHEGTQAENLDLQQGDLILEYDGETITSAQQLVDAVKARSAEQIVQMTVVRDGNRFPLTLNGGLIGINILTVNVPPEQVGR